jgi:hypothetical protein
MRPAPIKQRIREAMAGRRDASYYEIIRAVFPEDQFPRAFRAKTGKRGGPPGCAMAFGRALRQMGWMDRRDDRLGRRVIAIGDSANG